MASISPSADAVARLERLVAPTDPPELAGEDLDELLVDAARRDAAGLAPGEAGWVETYNFNLAAAQGWTRKAGRAAAGFNFAAGAVRSDRAQIHQHCLAMAAEYRARAAASRSTSSSIPIVSAAAAAARAAAESSP